MKSKSKVLKKKQVIQSDKWFSSLGPTVERKKKLDLRNLSSFSFPKVVKVCKLTERGQIPKKTYESDAGYDVTITRLIKDNNGPNIGLYGTDIDYKVNHRSSCACSWNSQIGKTEPSKIIVAQISDILNER